VHTMQPAEQDQFFEKERQRWGVVVKEANIRVE